jgi:phage shock protein E
MATQKQRKGFDRAGAPATGKAAASGKSSAKAGATSKGQTRMIGIILGVIALAVVAVGGAVVLLGGGSGSSSPGTVVQTSAGSYTNITADHLASELKTHDFTFLNVKTPYIGEIAGTDLYIPYDQLAARASELPADKSAKIVVYCRSGNESAMAVQTLLSLGYTNLENLDGGMNAWQASGRTIVQKNRT